MTKTYDIVQVEEYLYMIDKEGEIQYDEWCFEIHEDYESPNPRIKDKNNSKMAWWLRRLNMHYLKEKPKEFGFWRKMDGSCWKILASNNPSLSDLPKLPVIKSSLNWLQQQADKAYTHCHGCNENDKNFWTNGYVHGYNANPNKYSEEDMRNAMRSMCIYDWNNMSVDQGEKIIDNHFKSLNQAKIPIQVEVEIVTEGKFESFDDMEKGTLKLNDNQIIVKRWIYE